MVGEFLYLKREKLKLPLKEPLFQLKEPLCLSCCMKYHFCYFVPHDRDSGAIPHVEHVMKREGMLDLTIFSTKNTSSGILKILKLSKELSGF